MLTIICGEDSISSRSYFISLQTDYKQKGYQIISIPANQIEQVIKSSGNELMLFTDKQVYAVEHLTTYTTRKKSKDFEILLRSLIDDKDIEVIDWESKGAREIKIKTPNVKEFKLSQSVFQLQEACFPGKLKLFLTLLNKLSESQEEGFIFVMLCRHIRTLILARTQQLPPSVPFWMKKKLNDQAIKWSLELLLGFYEGLARIDSSTKTSSNIYGVKRSIELLTCYFLK